MSEVRRVCSGCGGPVSGLPIYNARETAIYYQDRHTEHSGNTSHKVEEAWKILNLRESTSEVEATLLMLESIAMSVASIADSLETLQDEVSDEG